MIKTFSVNIYDTYVSSSEVIFERALFDSLNLRWNGGDEKTNTIVGSDLNFTMRVDDYSDAFFAHLFTDDEKRFKVDLRDEENDTVLWRGFLLPEQFSEPYTNNNLFVNFAANCGLGTLKNIYLPDVYYLKEHSVIDIITACLKLTFSEFEVYFTPAINNIQNDWNHLYLNGELFGSGSKKFSAYKILDSILETALLTVFQDDGKWYVVGHNKRNFLNLSYAVYSIDGVFLRNESVIKNTKSIKFLEAPMVGVHVPLKTIETTSVIEESKINKKASVEDKTNYTLINNDVIITAHQWVYTSTAFLAKYSTKDAKIYVETFATTYNAAQSISLLEPMLVTEGAKIQIEIELLASYTGVISQTQKETKVLDGSWSKVLPYDLYYTDPATATEVILYSNKNGGLPDDLRYQLNFNEGMKAELSIEFIAPVSAQYNLRFYRPVLVAFGMIDKIEFTKISGIDLSFEDAEINTNTIPQNYSLKEEVDLLFHDYFGLDTAFLRLNKLNERVTQYDTEGGAIINIYTVDGIDYVSVNFSVISLIENNQLEVYHGANRITITNIIYNYLNSAVFVFTYDAVALGYSLQDTDTLIIKLKTLTALGSDAAAWQQYTDAVYNVQYYRYADAFLDVYRKLYQTTHFKISGTILGLVSYNEILNFKYRTDKLFYTTNLEWHLSRGESSVDLCENFYGASLSVSLPPVVYAGLDISLTELESTTNLLATASDPDGTIVLVLWEVIASDGAIVIATPNALDTVLTGLTGDNYELKVTVTDNVGLTASDTLIITRQNTIVMNIDTLTQVISYPYGNVNYGAEYTNTYKLYLNPDLADNQIVRYKIDIVIVTATPGYRAAQKPTAFVALGISVASGIVPVQGLFLVEGDTNTSFNIIRNPGEYVQIRMSATALNTLYATEPGKVRATVQVTVTAEIASGPNAVITGIPQQLFLESIT